MNRLVLKILSGVTVFGILMIYKSGKMANTTKHLQHQGRRKFRDRITEQEENQLANLNENNLETKQQSNTSEIYEEIRQNQTQLGIPNSNDAERLQAEDQKNDDTKVQTSEDISMSDNDFDKRQEKRQDVLKSSCSRLNMTSSAEEKANPKALLANVKLLYSDKYKFIVCEIPKCGCSSIKKMLLVTEGFVNETDPQKIDPQIVHPLGDAKLDLRKLHDNDKISERLNSYYKLIIVRDPIYRLLSAYRNKLETYYPWSKYFAELSRDMHAKYAKNDSKLATFSEFLSYVAETDDSLDPHWEMYYKLCQPCSISYDFIAHIETIAEDMSYVMERVRMTNLNLPQNYDKSKTTDRDKFTKYVESIPKDTIDKVYEKYKTDYELFGFPKP